MKLEFNKPNLIQEYFTILLRDKINENGNNDVSIVTNKIDYYIDKIKNYKLLSEENRNIPNTIFLSLLEEISSLKLEEKDYLNILSLKEGIEYKNTVILNTDMIAKRKKTTYVSFKAAASQPINTKHIYTLEELNNLIDDKAIIILGEYLKTFNLERYATYEKYIKYDYYSYDDFINKNGRLFIYTLQYIRNSVTSERIKKELDIYIELLKSEINKITNNKYLINNSSIISKDISEELESKQTILKLK